MVVFIIPFVASCLRVRYPAPHGLAAGEGEHGERGNHAEGAEKTLKTLCFPREFREVRVENSPAPPAGGCREVGSFGGWEVFENSPPSPSLRISRKRKQLGAIRKVCKCENV